ncbi:hypothetical protein [Micromonospora aurantiaca (nom. illeg.)]|uniref:hypothetical protein n=1 Tax=Micromonospora aurantiaca (nom. illeg.) TaxID=47850 RepID=UPI00340B320C
MRRAIRKSRPLQAALLSGAAVAATLGVAAGPAQAASSSCTAPYFYKPFYRTCTTGTISANSSGHFIDVRVTACSGSPWRVWDTATGVTVASGKEDANRRITGLYGSSYRAKLADACYNDRVSIDNIA